MISLYYTATGTVGERERSQVCSKVRIFPKTLMAVNSISSAFCLHILSMVQVAQKVNVFIFMYLSCILCTRMFAHSVSYSLFCFIVQVSSSGTRTKRSGTCNEISTGIIVCICAFVCVCLCVCVCVCACVCVCVCVCV